MCGITVTVEDDRVVKVRGDYDHPGVTSCQPFGKTVSYLICKL